MPHTTMNSERIVRVTCVCSSLVLKSLTVQPSDLYYVYDGNSNVSAGIMASFVTRYSNLSDMIFTNKTSL